jgi:hypothetical protein
MRSKSFLIPSLALMILALGGCGGGGHQVGNTVPVKGRITYKGKPLIQGTVTFEPEDTGREAEGRIGPDGSFALTTFKEGDGAVIGVHRVRVSSGAVGPARTDALPTKHKKSSDSMVTVEVVEGKTEYDIDLK